MLSAEVSGIKLVPKSTPKQIAEAIIGAIERPRPYVHIPRGTAILNAASLAARRGSVTPYSRSWARTAR